MGSEWSFSQLKKLHGEEMALLMLEHQTGPSQFERSSRPENDGMAGVVSERGEMDGACGLCGAPMSRAVVCGLPYDGPLS